MVKLLPVKEHDDKVIIEKSKFNQFLDEFENLVETLEILSDKEMMKLVKKGIKDLKKGRVHRIRSASHLKRMLGL